MEPRLSWINPSWQATPASNSAWKYQPSYLALLDYLPALSPLPHQSDSTLPLWSVLIAPQSHLAYTCSSSSYCVVIVFRRVLGDDGLGSMNQSPDQALKSSLSGYALYASGENGCWVCRMSCLQRRRSIRGCCQAGRSCGKVLFRALFTICSCPPTATLNPSCQSFQSVSSTSLQSHADYTFPSRPQSSDHFHSR